MKVLLFFLFSVVAVVSFSESTEFEHALDLIEQSPAKEGALYWSAAAAALKKMPPGVGVGVFERAERLANERPSSDSADLLILLYAKQPDLRAKRLDSWSDSKGIDSPDGKLPAIPFAFLVASLSELVSAPKKRLAVGDAISSETFSLVRALLAEELSDTQRAQVAAHLARWQKARFALAENQPQRQHQLYLLYLFSQNALLRSDSREMASLLSELLEALGSGPVEDLLRKRVLQALTQLPSGPFAEVTLQKAVDSSEPSQPSKNLPGPFPPFPGVDANELLSALVDDRVLALPYPSASLSRGGKVVSGQALEIFGAEPRVFQGGTIYTAPPPMRDATVQEIVGMLGRFGFKGSDADVGCYYQMDNQVFGLPGYPAVPVVRKGILVDAYSKRTGGPQASKPTPAEFKFWVASVIKNKEESDWYAVRWSDGISSSPLGKDISLSTKELLMRREDINMPWTGTGNVQPYTWWPAVRDPDRHVHVNLEHYYKKEPYYSDPSRPWNRRFADAWDDLVAEQYSLPHADPISCLGNCWSAGPTAIEPGSGWQLIKVSAQSDFPLVLYTNTYPLITHRSGGVHHGAGGFTSNSFDVIAIRPRKADVPMFADIHPLDLAKSVPMGLLSYADALSRSTLKGGWLAPQIESAEMSALVALVRLSMLNSLASMPIDHFPVDESPTVPWKQRLKLLKVSLGTLAQKVFNRYHDGVSEAVRVHHKERMHTKAVLERVIDALESEDTLSEDRIYVLLGYAKRHLKVRETGVLKAKEDLVLSLKGAHERLVERLKAAQTSFSLSCDVLQRLQVTGANDVVSMVSEADVLGLCQSVSPAR